MEGHNENGFPFQHAMRLLGNDYSQNTLDEYSMYTKSQDIALNWMYRFGSVISLLSGVYMFHKAWERRHHVYHRFILVMATYIILWSPWGIIGVAAIPKDTPGVWGAKGNTATCTAQGFFYQLHFAVPTYYVTLSVFSWIVVVYGRFNASRYAWVEKYIHIVANSYGIGTAFYLLSIEAFNSNGIKCWVASLPSGCGNDSGITCTRGPQDLKMILGFLMGVPGIVMGVIAPAIMMALTGFVYLQNRSISDSKKDRDKSESSGESLKQYHPSYYFGMTPHMVAKQSIVYIVAMYIAYLPALIHHSMAVFGHKFNFAVSAVYCLLSSAMGIWYALVYRYFSTSGVVVNGSHVVKGIARKANQGHLERKGTSITARPTLISSIQVALEGLDPRVIDHDDRMEAGDFSSGEQKSNSNERVSSNGLSRELDEKDERSREFTFNIFDGTAPVNSPYADFIFCGDEEDEENEIENTRYWANCQDLR